MEVGKWLTVVQYTYCDTVTVLSDVFEKRFSKSPSKITQRPYMIRYCALYNTDTYCDTVAVLSDVFEAFFEIAFKDHKETVYDPVLCIVQYRVPDTVSSSRCRVAWRAHIGKSRL